MTPVTKRLILWSSIGGLVLLSLIYAFWPRALAVDLDKAVIAPLMITVGDEGETRVVDVYVVSAPITGHLRRIDSTAGDRVVAGQTAIAEIEPATPELLDSRTDAEAQALLSAAASAEVLARSALGKAAAELRFAESELDRSRELAAKGTLSERDLEASERSFDTASAALGIAQANMEVRRYELEQARLRLMPPTEAAQRRSRCACVRISSPVDGKVLRVMRKSEGFVRAGEGLIEIGNPQRLEVVVDLLSSDAVKVSPGDAALIENWGGATALQAKVRRVEPFGFTKVSALGIEEQRVNVILDILSPREEWPSLGHGYQIDVRIILWQNSEVLQVPMTALFREGDDWAIFVNQDGRARRRIIELGHSTSEQAQILAGLTEGDEIVVYPGEGIDDDVRIIAR